MKAHFAFLCLAVAIRSGIAGEPTGSVHDACTQLVLSSGAEYTLTVPAEERKVTVQVVDPDPQHRLDFSKGPDGSWQAGLGVSRSVLPSVLPVAFADNGNGQVLIQIKAWGKRETNQWQFSSIGPAEAIYALRCLAPDRKLAEQVAAKVTMTKFVAPLSSDRHKDILTIAREIPMDDPEVKAIVKESFNAHRAEILAKFGRGKLYYPPAETLGWNYRKTGGELYALSGCSDRLFSATFVVRLDRKPDGSWKFRQIYAYEWFKGEY